MMNDRRLLPILCMLVVCATIATRVVAKTDDMPLLEGSWTSLGVVDDHVQLRGVAKHLTKSFSPDGTAFAYTAAKGSRRLMIVEGEPGPLASDILLMEPAQDRPERLSARPDKALLVFSPDGDRHIYVVELGTERKVVVDGTPVHAIATPAKPRDAETLKSVQFSVDGGRYAYAAPVAPPEGGSGSHWSIVRDGEVIDTGPDLESVILNRDGTRIAYDTMSRRGGGRLVVDDLEVADLYGVQRSEFLPDGRHLAVVRAGLGGGKTARRVLVDTVQMGPDLDQSRSFEMTTTPEGKVGYIADTEDGRRVAVVEGEIRAEGDSIGDLAMSPDASRIAYTRAPEARRDAGRGRGEGRRGRRGSRGSRRVVVVDGEAGREWDAVEHLQFSADGRAVAFVGVVDRVHYPIVDGREWPGFRRLENATFAPAGRRFAAWGTDADNEGTQLVVDGTTYTTDGDLLAFTFSEDGMHDAHAVKVGKVGQRQRVFRNNELLCETVGLDSQPIEPGRGPTSDRRVRGDGTRWTLWLSPEGRRLLHTTRDGIFVDGEPMIEYDDTIRHLRGLTATRGFEHVAGHRSARDRSFVLLDGRITPFCDAVYPAHFLPDGALTAVVEKDGEFRRFTSRP